MDRDNLKSDILRLRNEGLTYQQIKEQLGCAKSTVAYYCGEGQRAKAYARHAKLRGNKVFAKFETFKYAPKGVQNKFTQFKGRGQEDYDFTLQQVKELIAETPNCYLCGSLIDYEDPSSFNFDHIIPTARGGLNTLDNLGIACFTCNRAKCDMTVEEFTDMCRRIADRWTVV